MRKICHSRVMHARAPSTPLNVGPNRLSKRGRLGGWGYSKRQNPFTEIQPKKHVPRAFGKTAHFGGSSWPTKRYFLIQKTRCLKSFWKKLPWRWWDVSFLGGLPLREDLRRMNFGVMKSKKSSYFQKRLKPVPITNMQKNNMDAMLCMCTQTLSRSWSAECWGIFLPF